MQRRAAALYGAFFVVLALGSYGMIAAATPPTVSLENPDHRLSDGGDVTVQGRAYDVAVSGGSATLSWVNESARYTAEWATGSNVTLQGTNYSVETRANTSPPQVRLTEVQTLGENVTTTTVDGTEYVVLGQGDDRTLVPRDQYLRQNQGEPEQRTVRQGASLDYQGNQTTLATVTNESATLAWTAPRNETVEAGEGDEIDLNGVTFVAHFPDDATLVLDRDVRAYERQLEVQATYDERINGLWAVVIISMLSAVGLLGLSYLPSRY